jgi:hypothetical protein
VSPQYTIACRGLPREDRAVWLDGPSAAAGLLCRPSELGMRVERTGGLGPEIVGTVPTRRCYVREDPSFLRRIIADR